jgi:hypothetical protein
MSDIQKLSLEEQFANNVNDINNWVLPKGQDELGQLSWYYEKVPKFKIVREAREYNKRFLLNDPKDVPDYLTLLRDTFLSEDVWKHKKRILDCSVEESFKPLKVKVFFDNINIWTFDIIEIYLKHYPTAGNNYHYYIPAAFPMDIDGTDVENSVKSLISYPICRLLYKEANGRDGNDKIFKMLNYDFIKNPSEYMRKNMKLLHERRSK